MTIQFNANKNLITNTYVYYTCIAKPTLKYGMGEGVLPHHNKEYKTTVLLTEEIVKEMRRALPLVKAIKNAKEHTAEEFEKIFKAKPPFKADYYYTVQINKSADYKSGDPTIPPKQVAVKGCADEILPNTEIGNGSKAHVQFTTRDWEFKGVKGQSMDLFAVGIVELVKYSKGGNAGFAFEVEELDVEQEVKVEAVKTVVHAEEPKKEERLFERLNEKKVTEDLKAEAQFDDDIPF